MGHNELLRKLPRVDFLLEYIAARAGDSATALPAVHGVLEELRSRILDGRLNEIPDIEEIAGMIDAALVTSDAMGLVHVVNATGVVLHTNLGRACLSKEAAQAAMEVGMRYSTLEYDLESGSRGTRTTKVEELLRELTGAEAATVVNNNAAALLLVLSELARGQEVIVSRGELVEIGGSFRVPDIMEQSGALLREVGTTNMTRLCDYKQAISHCTAALLKIHTSNYRIVGFTESVPPSQLVELGAQYGIPIIEDMGSGALENLSDYGLADEPYIRKSIRQGTDVLTVSGDKLLGGPQAGIILGRSTYLERIKRHPLMRALRVDKMTLAALQVTLQQYCNVSSAKTHIPVLLMLSANEENLRAKAKELQQQLNHNGFTSEIIRTDGQVGGGSAPMALLPSCAVAITPTIFSVDTLCAKLRSANPHIVGRICHNKYLLDVRTIFLDELSPVAYAVNSVFEGVKNHA